MSNKQLENASSWSTLEWHTLQSVSPAPRALLCRCSPVSLLRNTELMGMWTSNTKESHGLRGSCLAQLWEDHWRIRDKSSAVTVCPVPHFCSCSGAEALGSCSSCAEWESCSSALAQISPCRPRVGSMDRRGPGAVCRLTLQCVPKLESLSGYSSRNHQSHTQLERPLRKDGTTLEPQVLPKPAASLQTLAPLLHITTVRKCKIHPPRFNPFHLSFPHSRALTSTSNSCPQAAEFMELCIESLMQKWAWCSESLRWGLFL